MKHKIIWRDCVEVMQDMENVDIIFTSPPYNMRTRVRNGKYTTSETSEHFSKKYKHFEDALSIEEYYLFHKEALKLMLHVSPLVFWNIQIVTGSKEAIFKIIGDFHKDIKDVIVWDKGVGQPAMHGSVLNRGYELILILERNADAGRAFHNSYFKRGEMSDIWKIPRGKNKSSHGTTFSVELVEKILKGWSKEGDIILDPFCGTGTTLVAAEKTRRNSVGIEISKEYCELSYQRLSKEVSQLKMDRKFSTIEKIGF